MNTLKKIKNDAKLAWHSLFYGLRAADSVMQSQTSGEDGVEINDQVKPSGPYADMLENKVTKEVEEVRDKMYRVYREADKYKFDKDTMTLVEEEIINEKGEKETVLTFKGELKKKSKEDFMKHAPVYEKDGFKLRVIQEVKHYSKTSSFDNYVAKGIYDYDSSLTLDRDFIPRFELEKFTKRVVVRNSENENATRAEVDLYLPAEASQFGKIDAILIANLHRMMYEKNYRSDITDFKSISWYTDHAWNCDDMYEFVYDDPKLVDINIFDGSFVLTFDCNIVKNGVDIVEKYKTKELDEKYKYQLPKDNGVGLMAASRRADRDEKNEIDLNNLGKAKINLSEE